MGATGKRSAFGRSLRALACGLGCLSVVALAHAQDTAPPEPAAQARPPDIVRLKNGGLLRGTISELVPGESVLFVTITGETKRISMTEVEYAGPDATQAQSQAAPGPAPKPQPPQAVRPPQPPHGPVPARLEPTDVPITFYAAPAEGGRYTKLCTAPCDATLPPGNHRFALSEPGSSVRKEALPALRITSPAVVRGTLRQRGIVRGIGALILVVGGVAGGYLWVTATEEQTQCWPGAGQCFKAEITNEEQLWAGRALLAGSVVAGIIMLTRSDTVTVELVPGARTGLSAPGRFAAARDRKTPHVQDLSGLSLVGRF